MPFTPIVTGAAANASVVNAPLYELDDAVAAEAVARVAGDNTLDDRIDNIVGYSGTSTVEVVDARTAGNTGSAATSLTTRLEWLEGAQNVYAAAYGFAAGASATANQTAINAALAAATAFAAPAVVWLPAGKFPCRAFTVPAEIALRGARMPFYDMGTGMLKGGTILYNTDGTGSAVVTLTDGAALMDLGIQTTFITGTAPNQSSRNCITGGDANDTLIHNVATAGVGFNHGCVFTGGLRNRIDGFFAAEVDHGLVFKASYNQASRLRFVNCSTTCFTLTSDDGQDCSGNSLSDIHSVNDNVGTGGSIRVYTDGSGTFGVFGNVISHFYLQTPGIGIYCNAKVSAALHCRHNRFSNGYIEGAQTNGIWLDAIDDVVGNGADYNDFANITVVNATTYSFNNQFGGVHNALHNCRSITPGTGSLNGTWGKADIGLVNPSGMVLHLDKSVTQTIATGVVSWVDVTWTDEFDHRRHDLAGTPAELGNPPVPGAIYRIRAVVTFSAHATGQRYVRLARSLNNWTSEANVAENVATPGGASSDCTVSVELITVWNTSYEFKVGVMQNSGVTLNVQILSHLTVELVR